MANVAFLEVKTRDGNFVILDREGQEFALPEDNTFLERVKGVADNPKKVIRIVLLNDDKLAYIPALRSKILELSNVTEENFPELWKTVKSGTTKDSSKPVDPEVDFINKLKSLVKNKPSRLKLSDLKWKYVCRCALKGKNIMMVGEKGSGKTLTAYSLSRALPEHEFFVFNLGATQDPRGELIGNTHFNKDEGTVFKKSEFVRAITTPGAIILLDELSRAHPDAWNILMSVLDQDQRYLRISEDPETPKINVAPGVSFIATANKGIKYTSTRAVDAALEDRFIFIEFDMMDKQDMEDLLMELYPNGKKMYAQAIAGIYDTIRKEVEKDTGKLENYLSPRQCIEGMDLMGSGFKLEEVAETAIYPFFDKDGGTDSERTFVQQTVQKYIPKEPENTNDDFETDIDFENLSNDKPF